MREKLPNPWKEVCLVLMKYLTLEGRYGVCYYYHFPLLNHFFHRDFIFLPFFLLHELEDIIVDVKEKKKKGVSFTVLHQGLIFRLYQLHLAPRPPRIVKIDILAHLNPWPQMVSLRIIGPRAPTAHPSPNGTPVNSSPMGKKGR